MLGSGFCVMRGFLALAKLGSSLMARIRPFGRDFDGEAYSLNVFADTPTRSAHSSLVPRATSDPLMYASYIDLTLVT